MEIAYAICYFPKSDQRIKLGFIVVPSCTEHSVVFLTTNCCFWKAMITRVRRLGCYSRSLHCCSREFIVWIHLITNERHMWVGLTGRCWWWVLQTHNRTSAWHIYRSVSSEFSRSLSDWLFAFMISIYKSNDHTTSVLDTSQFDWTCCRKSNIIK